MRRVITVADELAWDAFTPDQQRVARVALTDEIRGSVALAREAVDDARYRAIDREHKEMLPTVRSLHDCLDIAEAPKTKPVARAQAIQQARELARELLQRIA